LGVEEWLVRFVLFSIITTFFFLGDGFQLHSKRFKPLMHPSSLRAFERHDLKHPGLVDLIITKQNKLPSYIYIDELPSCLILALVLFNFLFLSFLPLSSCFFGIKWIRSGLTFKHQKCKLEPKAMGFIKHKYLVHFYSQKNPHDISKIWVSQGETKKRRVGVSFFFWNTHPLWSKNYRSNNMLSNKKIARVILQIMC